MTSAAKVSMFSFQPWSFWKTGTYLSWATPAFWAAHLLLPPLFCPLFYLPRGLRNKSSDHITARKLEIPWLRIKFSLLTQQHITQENSSWRQEWEMTEPRFRWHTTQMPAAMMTKTDHLTWERAAFREADLHWPWAAWEFWMGDHPAARAAQKLLHSNYSSR